MRSRFTCPNCGKPHCFVRYVDENGDMLHESVGRCNHESSCGYHYTPKQFFADHPDQKPGKDWRYDRVPVMAGPDRASHSRSFLRAARFLDPELADDVEKLVEEFGLEFWGAERDTPLCHSERGEESPK